MRFMDNERKIYTGGPHSVFEDKRCSSCFYTIKYLQCLDVLLWDFFELKEKIEK